MKTPTRFAVTSALVLPLFLVGCGSTDQGDTSSTPPKGDATYSAGPFTVDAGSELVMCTYVQGTNDVEEDITRFDMEQSKGGHHLIVYTMDHQVDLQPHKCSQGGQPSWSQIMVTQIESDSQIFPEGVGFHVKPHQQYVMETHFINTTTSPLEVHTSFSTTYGKVGEVKERASTYFFGTMNIDLQPNASAHAESACSPPLPISLHSMFGHEHRHGTGVSVDYMPASGSMQHLYDTTNWDSPPTTHFTTPIDVAMDDKVHVSCDWNNDTAQQIRYPHEMCFAIGYFWPAESGVACISGGGKPDCECQQQGKLDTGPGGSAIEVTLNRKDMIPNLKQPVDTGAPIYCALFRDQDWSGIQPKPGAQPYYFRDQVDVPLKTSADTAMFDIEDVTPGDYRVSCMMDAIGGGFYPGSGDVVNLTSPKITAVKGQKAPAQVTLDFVYP